MVWFAIAALGYVIAVKDHNWFGFSRTAATLLVIVDIAATAGVVASMQVVGVVAVSLMQVVGAVVMVVVATLLMQVVGW